MIIINRLIMIIIGINLMSGKTKSMLWAFLSALRAKHKTVVYHIAAKT